ncbi:hypothetical protein KQX54_018549 [Cotesia glomerata]|uniref:Maturase K n=1 Tax=Cotesia glomerata TaxID=32391 RepID=A0AAV7HU99_COTGL|nr:hypothetical protein KQX54_018549 [Cotesia glomerata]
MDSSLLQSRGPGNGTINEFWLFREITIALPAALSGRTYENDEGRRSRFAFGYSLCQFRVKFRVFDLIWRVVRLKLSPGKQKIPGFLFMARDPVPEREGRERIGWIEYSESRDRAWSRHFRIEKPRLSYIPLSTFYILQSEASSPGTLPLERVQSCPRIRNWLQSCDVAKALFSERLIFFSIPFVLS